MTKENRLYVLLEIIEALQGDEMMREQYLLHLAYDIANHDMKFQGDDTL